MSPAPPRSRVSFTLRPSEGNFQSGVDVMDICPSGVIILREIELLGPTKGGHTKGLWPLLYPWCSILPICYWGAHRNNGVHVLCSSIPCPFFLVLINFLEGLKIVHRFHIVFDIKSSNICSQREALSRSPFPWILSSLERPSLFMLDHKSVCPPLLSRRVRVMSNHLGPSHLITSRLYTQVKMVPLISHLSGI